MSKTSAENEWSEVTRGERFVICISSAETSGVADPRNGVFMHTHDNEEKHFIVLEGNALITNGDSRAEVAAGAFITISRGVPHAWCDYQGFSAVNLAKSFHTTWTDCGGSVEEWHS